MENNEKKAEAVEFAARTIQQELAKSITQIALSRVAKHGPARAMLIVEALTPVANAMGKELEKIPALLVPDVIEFLSEVMATGVSAHKGLTSMIGEIRQAP